MNIGLVLGAYDALGGGAERWTDRHARRLLALGHQVFLIARRFRGAPAGAHLTPIEGKAARTRLGFGAEVERQLIRLPLDVTHDMGDGWSCDLYMPHHGVRSAAFAQNTCLLPAWLRWTRKLAPFLPRYREFRELERRQYDLAPTKTFVAISGMVRKHMQAYHRIPSERLTVVYNGVDTRRFCPATDADRRASFRKQLGFTTETVALFIAHNFRLKGLDTLLEALGAARRARANLGLVVVGPDNIGPYVGLAKAHGCEEFVRFVGAQADPVPYYQAADLYAQPTFYDPCSLVVLEALACGLPVVTTRHNGVSELLTPAVEGFVLDDPRDATGLAENLRHLSESSVRRRASSAARALSLRHSEDENLAAILELYKQVHAKPATSTRVGPASGANAA